MPELSGDNRGEPRFRGETGWRSGPQFTKTFTPACDNRARAAKKQRNGAQRCAHRPGCELYRRRFRTGGAVRNDTRGLLFDRVFD
jgi:hypothetical protein